MSEKKKRRNRGEKRVETRKRRKWKSEQDKKETDELTVVKMF